MIAAQGPADLATFTAWAAGPAQERVEINMKLYDAWLLLSCVQLSLTHPGIGKDLGDELHGLGARLDALIVAFAPAEIAALASAGWDRASDVPTGQEGRTDG